MFALSARVDDGLVENAGVAVTFDAPGIDKKDIHPNINCGTANFS